MIKQRFSARLRHVTLCSGAFMLSASAVAQEPPDAPADAPTEEVPEAAEEPAATEEAPAATPGDAVDAAAPAVEKAPAEETIFIVQGKEVLVGGRFELAPQIATSIADEFTAHSGVFLSAIYHLKENVAVEAVGGVTLSYEDGGVRLGGHDSDLTTEIKQLERLEPERANLYQYPWLVAADLQWSPLYGKVAIQDAFLGQFNLYLSVGLGVVGLQMQQRTGTPRKNLDLNPTFGTLPAMALTTSFGGGLRFYFTEHIGVRAEIRDYVTSLGAVANDTNSSSYVKDALDTTFGVNNLILAQVGVSFLF
jgi:outer membrane beta-barrel protein